MNQWTRWKLVLAVTLGLGLGFARPAFAWNPNSSTCTTKNVITANSDLNFGSIASPAATGTVTVHPDGTYSPSGVDLLSATGLAPASFSVTDPGAKVPAPGAGSCTDYPTTVASVTVSVTGSVTLYDTTGTNSMMVGNLSWALCMKGGGACGTEYTAPTAVQWDYTTDDLYVGGMLTVNASQAGGSYATANGGGVPITITLTWN